MSALREQYEDMLRANIVLLARAQDAEALNRDLLDALKSNGSWIAMVLKGIRSGKIADQTILDTGADGPSVGMTPLSVILEREIGKASAAIARAEGTGPDAPPAEK